MKSIKFFVSVLVLASSLFIISCDNNDPVAALEATTVSNLAADPATGYDPNTGAPIGYTGKFKLFSFSTGAAVANSDSASSKWDIGFKGTTIIVNSGTSGPGTAGAIVKTGIFEEVISAPEDGYATDNKATPSYAIPTGSDNGWYHYDGAAMTITPIAGRVIVIKTADGRYAKFEILSYYKNAPATINAMQDEPRYYTFRFIYQPDGSKNLK